MSTPGDQMKRRFKIMYVDEQIMIDSIVGKMGEPDARIGVSFFKGIPAGAEVVSVNYDLSRRSFAVGLYHESFPPLPTGQMLEAVTGITMEKVEYIRKEEDS